MEKVAQSDKCTAALMRELLRSKFDDSRRYAVAEEVGNRTGYQRRRLDMVVVDVYESNGYSIEGIEIKVSKPDLRRELQDSSKHNIFFENLDYYSLAAPFDVIDKDLIPKHWGIYAAKQKDDGTWYLRTVRKPLSLHDKGNKTIDKGFFACLARAISCQSPTAERIEQAEMKGYKKGVEDEKRRSDYQVRRASEQLERLDVLEDLFDKCRVWGNGSVEKGIAKFEAFRQVGDMNFVERKLESTRDELTNAIDAIKTVFEEELGADV